MTEHHDVDALVDELNTVSLLNASLTKQQTQAKNVIALLYDTVLELAGPASKLRQSDTFEKHIDHVIAVARPFVDATARNIRVGTVPNFDGRQVLLEVLPNGEFHLASRDAEWNSWSAGVWGWLS